MSIEITVDITEPMREMRRFARGPDISTVHLLDAVIEGLFQETQALVHIITGSLRNSGTHSTTHRGAVWRGQVRYGGASTGFPHDPVRYARAELDRSGEHDFMAPERNPALHEQYTEAILHFMRGGR